MISKSSSLFKMKIFMLYSSIFELPIKYQLIHYNVTDSAKKNN